MLAPRTLATGMGVLRFLSVRQSTPAESRPSRRFRLIASGEQMERAQADAVLRDSVGRKISAPSGPIIGRSEANQPGGERDALRALLLADDPGPRRIRPPGARRGRRRLCRRGAPA